MFLVFFQQYINTVKRAGFFLFLIIATFLNAQDKYSIVSIPKELLENSNSILLDEFVSIDVSQAGKIKVKTKRVWAVLNARGNNDAALMEGYDANSKVKKIEAVIYDAFGKKKEHFRKKNFSDLSHSGYSTMYSDSRVLIKRYTPGSYPYIVVFESETESGDTGFINRWYPLKRYYESTQKSVYRITFDPTNKLRYKARNLENFDISIEETPTQITFTANNLKAIRYEEHAPSYSSIFPNVHFALDEFYLKGKKGSAKSWNDFGKWMSEDLLSDVNAIPEATVIKIKNLIAGETTNEGKARKIYQYLQDKVRYISIQIGIGGWKPMPASDVDKLSYGDCKALTNYTKSLLDAVGIPSYYTILYSDRSRTDIMEDFVSIQGNHAILGIPDGDKITWLECTSQDVPFGYIGAATEDRNVLIITPEGGEIVRSKIYEADENLQDNRGRIDVKPSGEIVASLIRTSGGIQYESKYLLPKQKKDEIDEYYKKYWNNINEFTLTSTNFTNNSENILFTEEIELISPSYTQAVSDGFLFIPNVFNQVSYIPPRIENRKQLLEISYGFVDEDKVKIFLPSEFIAAGLPDPIQITTNFGSYKASVVETEEGLTYNREIRIEKGIYPAEEYENYREFLRTVKRHDQNKILLKRISK